MIRPQYPTPDPLAGDGSDRDAVPTMRGWRSYFPIPEWCLLGLCLFLFFFRLGSVPIFDIDEGLYVTCARNMVTTGDWTTPMLNARPPLHPIQTLSPFFEKPILTYWCAAASMKLFGISEWAARLPVALASLITTFCIYLFGRRWFGRRAGLLAGAIYATAPMTLVNARQMTTDALLVLLLTVALMAFWESGVSGQTGETTKERRRLRYPLLFWAVCGLAVLAKGAVGLLFPLLVIVVTEVFERLRFRFRWAGRVPGELSFGIRWNRFRNLRQVWSGLKPIVGIPLLLLVAVPWHILVAQAGRLEPAPETVHGVVHPIERTFYQEYILIQHIGRFRGLDTVHNMPFFIYIAYFLLCFFPWSCFAPTAFRSPSYEGSQAKEEEAGPGSNSSHGEEIYPANSTGRAGGRDMEADPFPWPSIIYVSKPEDATHRFLLIWFWTIFVFFSLGAAKLPTYIAPCYPAAALLVGRWFDYTLKDSTRLPATWRALRGVLAVATVLLAGVMAVSLLPSRLFGLPPLRTLTSDSVIRTAQHLALTLFIGCALARILYRNGQEEKWRRYGILALLGTMVSVIGVTVSEGFSVLGKDVLSPYKQVAEAAAPDAARGIPVVLYHFTNRRPSMLYYAASYSPFEHKEAPLVPYLDSIVNAKQEDVDVIVEQSKKSNPVTPELAEQSQWSVTSLEQRGNVLLFRLHRRS